MLCIYNVYGTFDGDQIVSAQRNTIWCLSLSLLSNREIHTNITVCLKLGAQKLTRRHDLSVSSLFEK